MYSYMPFTATTAAEAGRKKRGRQTALKPWTTAIRIAVNRMIDGKKALDVMADKLVEKAAEGDAAAMREVGDRLEGRPIQPIEGRIDANITVQLIRFADPRLPHDSLPAP